MEKANTNEWIHLEEYPNYEINRNGQLRNANSKIVLQYYKRRLEGAVFCWLVDKNGLKKNQRVDELVAKLFIPNDGTHTDADLVHLDGNMENCSVDNLSWDSEEYALKQYYDKTGLKKPKDYFTFYPLEEFPESPYEINKMGQLRNKTTHKILYGGLNDAGYRAFTIRINNKTIYRLAHVMVAKQFIPNPENKPLVNHIDENKDNPCIDNLEWVTSSENIRHGSALSRGNLGRYKLVNEYSVQGKYLRTWKSIKHLSEFFDSIYPLRGRKSYNSLLKYYLETNRQENAKKIVFANRVFLYFEGDCDDLNFHIRKSKRSQFHEFTLDEINVPIQYLVEDLDDRVDSITVLQSMLRSKLGLSISQKIAIKYAIKCIKKVKEEG